MASMGREKFAWWSFKHEMKYFPRLRGSNGDTLVPSLYVENATDEKK